MSTLVVQGDRQIFFPQPPTDEQLADFLQGAEPDYQGHPDGLPDDIRARFLPDDWTVEVRPDWTGSYRYLLTTPIQTRITTLADIVAPVARARGDVAVAILAPVDDVTKRVSLTAAMEALNRALNDVSQGLDANERAILRNWNHNYHLGLELSFLP